MVRFAKDKLIVEIPCTDMSPADYYEGLQHALYDVFWLATSQSQTIVEGPTWLATYLCPALAVLDPSVKDLLNQMAETAAERPSTTSSHFTDKELVTLLEGMKISRLKELLRRIDFFTNLVDKK